MCFRLAAGLVLRWQDACAMWLMASSVAIQNPLPSVLYMTFAEPTGLFLGLVPVAVLVVDACVVFVPAPSSLSFLGERHSYAQ